MIEPFYQDDGATLYHADCRDVLTEIQGITAVVTDPPYGLSFMGKGWDHGIPGKHFWEIIGAACLPGAGLFAFGGTRTYHRLVCAIEDAGREIRDCLQWLYGSGFPKSHDISKGIDADACRDELTDRLGRSPTTDEFKAAWATWRETVGIKPGHEEFANRNNLSSVQSFTGTLGGQGGFDRPWMNDPEKVEAYHALTAPATDVAKTWHGYGTALKPAHEPICLAMNPIDGTFAANAVKHGVAGINVDRGRIGSGDPLVRPPVPKSNNAGFGTGLGEGVQVEPAGRWPANVIHDGSDEVLAKFPATAASKGTPRHNRDHKSVAKGRELPNITRGHDDSGGSAARFFYCAKASKAERNRGCDDLPLTAKPLMGEFRTNPGRTTPKSSPTPRANNHPTVKPLALMRYLLTLVTMPERNLVLDPFAGSGSTGVACKELGLPCILIEQDESHCKIIAARIAAAVKLAPEAIQGELL